MEAAPAATDPGILIGSTMEALTVPLAMPTPTILGSGYGGTLAGTPGNDVFDPGSATSLTTMLGNGGNDVFYVHNADDVVVAQSGGVNTVINDAAWGSYTLPDNVQNLVYAGAGNQANGGITLIGNALDDTIVAGVGGDTLVAGTGNDTLVGGYGADTFVIGADSGNDTIINFHRGAAAGRDMVQLAGLGFQTFTDVQAALSQSGRNVILALGTGHTLTIVNEQLSHFTAADFGLPEGSGAPPAGPSVTITIGSGTQSLLGPLTLPVATLRGRGWGPTLTGTAGNDVFDPGRNAGGTATMIGNGGNDVFYVHGSNNVVVAQPGGVNTVITDYGWGAYTLPDNVQNLIYTGTATYTNGWITLVGNTLDDTIVAGAGGDALQTGSGSDTLVGGTGGDMFLITPGGGSDTIINFQHGGIGVGDVVQLQGSGFTDFAGIKAALQQSGTNAVLALGGGRALTFVNQQTGSFVAADFGLTGGGGGGGGGGNGGNGNGGNGNGGTGGNTGGGGNGGAIVTNPVIVQPAAAGQIVGFQLRNGGASAAAPHEVQFAQTFAPGAVPAGSQLIAVIGGQSIPVQMDVKTSNPDGSVRLAVLTLLQPALAAGASADGMLSLTSPANDSAIDLSTLAASNLSLAVTLGLHNADGSITNVSLNAATLLQQAIRAGQVTTLLHGPQVTEARFNAPIAGSLHVTFDVSLFADGSTSTGITFANDIAMSANGGTVVYDATITQNGTVALQQNNITQYQYQTWHQTVTSNGAPAVQVVQDIAALERTGAIANYDLTAGVTSGAIAAEGRQLGGPTYGILGSASVLQYMPTTGGRPDIGPQPQWISTWLESQDPTAQAYALAQANAAGSVPWHFTDTNTGTYLKLTDYPNLWVDGRAAGNGSYTALTQAVPTNTGWTADAAHQPDLSYVAYILTGDQQYLDQLNAQASWAEAIDWTPFRQNGAGLVANGQDQVRAQAWSLREIDEAAYANPAGSAMGAYFTQLENTNWHWLVSQIPVWTAAEGQAHGYLPGNYGGTTMAPWEQDYFVSTAVQAAEQGNADAVTFLKWETNFIAGRFLNAAAGFNPADGIAYNLTVGSAAAPLQTWAAIEQASAAAGQTNGAGWGQSQGDYAQLAAQSLAGIITVTGSTDAMAAYGWLLASGAPQLNTIAGTQFDIVPRLSDGTLLTADHVTISTDTSATTFNGADNDVLIHAGSGNDTLNGGAGINLLFAGSGNDTLNGNAGNDYLFGGSGTDVLAGGAGHNFMQAGLGADTFMLSASDVASDLIAGFKLGTDHLQIGAGGPSVAQLLGSMSADTAGDAVLHLSGAHEVTLVGITIAEVTAGLFH